MKPEFDWDALVARARAGDCGPLVAATRHLNAWHRAYSWPMIAGDYPAALLQFLIDDAASTGRPGRKPASVFRRVEAKTVFDELRATIKAFDAGGYPLKLIDKTGRPVNPEATRASGWRAAPSDRALGYLARQWNMSIEAARDRIYPRKAKSTTKKG